MSKNKNKQEERVRAVRKRAKELLKYCDNAEEGKMSYEEFEKRATRTQYATDHGSSSNPVAC